MGLKTTSNYSFFQKVPLLSYRNLGGQKTTSFFESSQKIHKFVGFHSESIKITPASFQKQTLVFCIRFLLHQPDQQLVDVLRGLAVSQQLVPKGQHRAGQQPALAVAEHQNPVSLASPKHGRTSAVDQLREDDLLRTAADGVHPPDPFHLIGGL